MSGSGDKASKNDLQAKIKELINDNKVMVFSKSYCPYCTKAKKILGQYKLNGYKVIELDVDNKQDGDDYMDILGEMTGADTVPRVFIGGEFIGGGDDTEKLEKKGELEKKLKQAGALEN